MSLKYFVFNTFHLKMDKNLALLATTRLIFTLVVMMHGVSIKLEVIHEKKSFSS